MKAVVCGTVELFRVQMDFFADQIMTNNLVIIIIIIDDDDNDNDNDNNNNDTFNFYSAFQGTKGHLIKWNKQI